MSSSDRVLRSQSATDATVAAAAAEAKGASETDAASEPDVTDVAAAGGVVDGAATADEEAQLLAEVAAAEAKVVAAKAGRAAKLEELRARLDALNAEAARLGDLGGPTAEAGGIAAPASPAERAAAPQPLASPVSPLSVADPVARGFLHEQLASETALLFGESATAKLSPVPTDCRGLFPWLDANLGLCPVGRSLVNTDLAAGLFEIVCAVSLRAGPHLKARLGLTESLELRFYSLKKGGKGPLPDDISPQLPALLVAGLLYTRTSESFARRVLAASLPEEFAALVSKSLHGQSPLPPGLVPTQKPYLAPLVAQLRAMRECLQPSKEQALTELEEAKERRFRGDLASVGGVRGALKLYTEGLVAAAAKAREFFSVDLRTDFFSLGVDLLKSFTSGQDPSVLALHAKLRILEGQLSLPDTLQPFDRYGPVEATLRVFLDLATSARASARRSSPGAASAGSAPRAAAAVALAQTKARPSYYFMSPAVHALAKHLRHCFRCGSPTHLLDACTAAERGCALCGDTHKADDYPQPPAAKNE